MNTKDDNFCDGVLIDKDFEISDKEYGKVSKCINDIINEINSETKNKF
jgi:hypothetical protein